MLKKIDTLRKIFDEYILKNKLNIYTCPCCWFPTLRKRNVYDICQICNWEDDWQDFFNQNIVKWWPNWNLSLLEAKKNIYWFFDYDKILFLLKDNYNKKYILNLILDILKYEELFDDTNDKSYELLIKELENKLLKFLKE